MEKRERTLDMTTGEPLRLILIYAVPLLIGSIFQQMYNVVDTMIAGQYLGSEAVAAIGATSMLYQMVMGITLGLNNGCAIVLSRLFGTGRRRRFQDGVCALTVLVLGMSVLFTIISLLLAERVLQALNTPADIFTDALSYIKIIFGGLVLTGMYNMGAGFLRSVGNSRTPLYFLILSSILNVSLDMFLVAGLGMGVVGTAIATVGAQGIAAFCCLVCIVRNYKDFLPEKGHYRMDKEISREMILTGVSMAAMEGIYATGSVVLQRAINGLGTAVITAHTSARRLIDLMKSPLGNLGNAAAAFAGQNYGADKPERIKQGVRDTILMSAAWCVLSLLFTAFGSTGLLTMLAGGYDAGILANAKMYLWMSTAAFFPLALLFILRFVMQATGHKIIPILSSLIELGVKVTSAFWMVSRFGYPGAAATEPLVWLLCGIFLTVIYLRQRKMKVFLHRDGMSAKM